MPGFYDQFVGIGAESTWSTPVARTEFHRAHKGTAAKHDIPQEPSAVLGYRDPIRMYRKLQSGQAKVRVPLVYEDTELLLEHCFGLRTTSGAGPYDHVFSLDDNPFTRAASPLIGATVEVHADLPDSSLESFELYGGRCTEFGAEFKIDEEVIWDADFVGKQVVQVAKTASPTYPDYDTDEVHPSQITLEIDDVATSVIMASFRCNNNLKTDRGFLGSAYIAAPLAAPGKRLITGQLDLEWDSKSLYDKFISGATAKLEIIATLSASKTFTLLFPKIKFTGETPEPDEGELMQYSLPFTALYDATDGALKMTLRNGVAS